jgi:hypothetical protein
MKKFIIVDTYNGEGYSESKAEIVELEDLDAAKMHAYNYLVESLGGLQTMVTAYTCGTLTITISDESISYDDEEDQGAVHFVEFEDDMLAIAIDPTINEFTVIRDAESLEELEAKLLDSEESEEGEDLEGTCHHLDDETIIYQKL